MSESLTLQEISTIETMPWGDVNTCGYLCSVSEILGCYKGGVASLKNDKFFISKISNPHHLSWIDLSECFDQTLVEVRNHLWSATDPSYPFWHEKKKWGYGTSDEWRWPDNVQARLQSLREKGITVEQDRDDFERKAEGRKSSNREIFKKICQAIDAALEWRTRMRASPSPRQALCYLLRTRARQQASVLTEVPRELFPFSRRELGPLLGYRWLRSWVYLLPPWRAQPKRCPGCGHTPCIETPCPFCVRQPCRWKS